MKARIFGGSDEVVCSWKSCLVGASFPHIGGGAPVIVLIQPNRESFSEVLEFSFLASMVDWIDGEADIVVAEHILNIIGCPAGEEYHVVIHVGDLSSTLNVSFHIDMKFVAYYSMTHWDLTPKIEETLHDFSWITAWPESLRRDVAATHIGSVMEGYVIRLGTAVIVEVNGCCMVFNVVNIATAEQNSCEHRFIMSNAQCKFSVSEIFNESKGEKLVPAICSSQFDFLRPFVSQLTNCIEQHFNFPTIALIPRCFLLSSPAGSGKSFGLELLAKHLNIVYGEHVNILYGSCSKLNSSTLNANSHENDDLMNRLVKVIGALDATGSWSSTKLATTVSKGGLMVLMIDDLDLLYRLYGDEDNISDNSMVLQTNSEVSDIKLFGYYLQFVLNDLVSAVRGLNVVVIGATSLSSQKLPRSTVGAPEFERTIYLSKPSRKDRVEIINQLLLSLISSRNIIMMTENQDVGRTKEEIVYEWSEHLASITRGYLPVDLKAVVNRAVLMASGTYVSDCIQLRWKHILDSVASISLRTLQNIDFLSLVRDTNKEYRWDDFAGYKDTIESVKRVLRPFSLSESGVYNKLMLFKQPRGMVLYGPSGCGKTLLAKVIASQMRMNFVRVQSADVLSKYFGQTEEKIRKLFEIARSTAPTVLFFDDFDSLAHKRSDDQDGGHANIHNRILSTFLNELDGVSVPTNVQNNHDKKISLETTVFVLAACKDIKLLDEALIRPGRLQHHIFLDYPSDDDVKALLDHSMKSLPLGLNLDLEDAYTLVTNSTILRPTAGVIEAFCNQLRYLVLRDEITSIENGISNGLSPQISQKQLDEVVKRLFIREDDYEFALAETSES